MPAAPMIRTCMREYLGWRNVFLLIWAVLVSRPWSSVTKSFCAAFFKKRPLSSPALFHHRQRAVEKIFAAEIAGFQGEKHGGFVSGGAQHRHAGGDFRPHGERTDAEAIDDRAGGLAAGDDQAAHAARDQPGADVRQAFLDPAAGLLAPMLFLVFRNL